MTEPPVQAGPPDTERDTGDRTHSPSPATAAPETGRRSPGHRDRTAETRTDSPQNPATGPPMADPPDPAGSRHRQGRSGIPSMPAGLAHVRMSAQKLPQTVTSSTGRRAVGRPSAAALPTAMSMIGT